MLYHTPATPKNCGRISRQGSRISICRVRERNIALPAMPMLWKKLEVTIWKPIIGKNITVMRSHVTESSVSSASDVKLPTTRSGTSIPTRKPKVVTAVA